MGIEEYLRELAEVADMTVSGLVRLSDMSVEEAQEFRAGWPDLEAQRQRQVVRELAELAEDNVELNFDVVFLFALGDKDAEVRLEAVRGLWEYEGQSLVALLLRMLAQDEDVRVRSEVALALGRFVLLAEYGQLGEQCFQEVEAGLRRVLEDEEEMDEVRGRALESISSHDGVWVRQAIGAAYESDVRGLKVSAVHAMGRSCESRWLSLILRELSSEDAEVRYEAALACGSLEDEEAVSGLAPLLEDPDEEVQGAAISALGQIGGGEAKRLLQGLVESSSEAAREVASEALGGIGLGEDPLSTGGG